MDDTAPPKIKSAIRRYIAQNLLFTEEDDEYADNASLLENGIIDSIGVMELVAFVEDNFDVEVADEDIVPENFDSVQAIADYVHTKQRASAPET